ncbi:MAG: FAD-dependent oxidoreductase [Deltaproteobacteria bacterium]|nr:FAD-dependent oxidoreductase [Deltaproteobacteria bacterium]
MNHYDAVIIGAGIAGLGVAGLLQGRGLKTVVLEKSKTPGGRSKTYELPGGWKVDTGTHCVDLGKYSACATLLRKLGKEIAWSRNLEGFMFYDGGTWKPMTEYLALSPKEIRKLAEMENWIRQTGDEEIDALDNVSLTKFIEEKVSSPRIAEFVKTVGMVQTTLTEADIISAGEFVAIYRDSLRLSSRNNFPFDNVRMPVGGIATMIGAMAEAYTEWGGALLPGTPVRRVNVKLGGLMEAVTDNETFRAPVAVIAAPIWHMLKVLSMEEMSGFVPEWTVRMRGFERETSASMGFTIGTKAPLFTSPCYLSARRLPDMDLPLQILGHSLFDDTIAPPGHMVAFMGACCTPAQAIDKDFREKTLAAFWELLKKMFPSMEADLLWKHDGFYVGIDGLSRSPGMTGRYRPPVYLPEVPGLYFAGDCYTGRGVGMNAAANSAMICADTILKQFNTTTKTIRKEESQ